MEVWEYALDTAMAELQGGAAPWRINASAAKALREDHYAKGFKEAYATNPGAWPGAAFKVLRMARCAGTLAGLLAEWKGGDPLTGEITLTHLLASMAVVKAGCGKGSRVSRGKPCEYVQPSADAMALLASVCKDFGIGRATRPDRRPARPARRRP